MAVTNADFFFLHVDLQRAVELIIVANQRRFIGGNRIT